MHLRLGLHTCVCVRASAHRKLNVRMHLDAKESLLPDVPLFKDFLEVLYDDKMCSLATVAGVAKRSSKEAYINTGQLQKESF